MKSNQNGHATPQKQGNGSGQKADESSRKKQMTPVSQPTKKATYKGTQDPEEMEEGTTLDNGKGEVKKASNQPSTKKQNL